MLPQLSVVLLLCGINPLQGRELIVETTHGRVQGVRTELTSSFKGIPYAMPPVGMLRWEPPQSPPSWHPEVLDASKDPPGCPQIKCHPPLACPNETSENCLYLNIYTPLNATNTSSLPVMLYIHGGDFFFRSAASPLYDGEVFVQRGNVVLVNINYRLGALGFLVTGDTEADARGNFGLMDQILAMKWVKANIRQFGGDPDKVTLFGQSAGAQSVIQHMTSEEMSSYFRYAIIESCPFTLPYKTYDEAYILGGLLAEELNCSVGDIACMRRRSAEDVTVAGFDTRSKAASPKYLEMFEQYGPYVDGVLVKGQPLDIFNKGQISPKPLIIGTTTEETVLYIYRAWNSPVSIETYTEVVGVVRPDAVLQILNQYPFSPTLSDQRENLVKLSIDLVYECCTRNATRNVMIKGQSNIWLYYWNHALSFPGWGNETFCDGRVCHGSEVVYVFQTAYLGNYTLTPEEIALSDDVIAYWSNFAWSGNPNVKGGETAGYNQRRNGVPNRKKSGVSKMSIVKDSDDRNYLEKLSNEVWQRDRATTPPFWPIYEASLDWPAMFFQTPASSVVQDRKAGLCAFWDNIGYLWAV